MSLSTADYFLSLAIYLGARQRALPPCLPNGASNHVTLHSFPLIPLSECASDGPFLSNLVHIDPYGSRMQGEGCENHCFSVLNATNALDAEPETRLPGRALSIAAPSCQQQPNGHSIWDL